MSIDLKEGSSEIQGLCARCGTNDKLAIFGAVSHDGGRTWEKRPLVLCDRCISEILPMILKMDYARTIFERLAKA